MGEQMGVSASTISAWERDETQPRKLRDVLTKWADATGVRTAWLLEGLEAPARSRCTSLGELRVITGGLIGPAKTHQMALPFLAQVADN